MKKQYWPFPILEENKQTSFHKKQISFMENAYNQGFLPYIFDSNMGIDNKNGRNAVIIYRGGKNEHWEPMFKGDDLEKFYSCSKYVKNCQRISVFFSSFDDAIQAMIRWMKGENGEDIFSEFYITTEALKPLLYKKK